MAIGIRATQTAPTAPKKVGKVLIPAQDGPHEAPVPGGMYPGIFHRVEEYVMPSERVLGDDPISWKHYFTIANNGKDIELTAISSRKMTRLSKARKWAERLRGRPINDGEEFDFSEVEGRECVVEVVVVENERGTFSRIADIFPTSPKHVAVTNVPDAVVEEAESDVA